MVVGVELSKKRVRGEEEGKYTFGNSPREIKKLKEEKET